MASQEEALTALARGITALCDDVEATYAPVLCGDVMDAAGVAAAHLERLLLPQLRAWLGTGNARATSRLGHLPRENSRSALFS